MCWKPGNSPESRILLLKFQQFSGGETSDPSCRTGHTAYAPNHADVETCGSQGQTDLRVNNRNSEMGWIWNIAMLNGVLTVAMMWL